MLEDFLSYIESNLSVFREDKLLLAISGGIDSMVMLQLFRQLDFKIIVAHINHSTRNGASDQDMAFVNDYCEKFSIPFYHKTLSFDALNKGNFQENARHERYSFLHHLKDELGCKWIATAHHKDDRWETFLMNLNRKSGLQGLTSLRAQENEIIHPLLCFSKERITNFAKKHKIDFVHDSSNDSNSYIRNTIRNKITPEVNTIFPDFIENVNQSIVHLDDSFSLLKELISKAELTSIDNNTGNTLIDFEKIQTFKNKSTLLFHMLEHFGFNYSTCCDILASNVGSRFFSSDFEGLLVKNRLIIRKKRPFNPTQIEIKAGGEYSLPDGRTLLASIGQPNDTGNNLWLDIDKIQWPLSIRSVAPGDKFKPHGMLGKTKSIKKLCSDLKINAFSKEGLLVVESNQVILQVIGIRSSHESTTTDIKNALTFNITD